MDINFSIQSDSCLKFEGHVFNVARDYVVETIEKCGMERIELRLVRKREFEEGPKFLEFLFHRVRYLQTCSNLSDSALLGCPVTKIELASPTVHAVSNFATVDLGYHFVFSFGQRSPNELRFEEGLRIAPLSCLLRALEHPSLEDSQQPVTPGPRADAGTEMAFTGFKFLGGMELKIAGEIYDLHNCFRPTAIEIDSARRVLVQFEPNSNQEKHVRSLGLRFFDVDFLKISDGIARSRLQSLEELGFYAPEDHFLEGQFQFKHAKPNFHLVFKWRTGELGLDEGHFLRIHAAEVRVELEFTQD